MSVNTPYLWLKDDVPFFRRRLPSHIPGKRFLVISLRTRDAMVARQRVTELSRAFDDLCSQGASLAAFKALTWGIRTVPETLTQSAMSAPVLPLPVAPVPVPERSRKTSPLISDLFAAYLAEHARGADTKFKRDTENVRDFMIAILGDRQIGELGRADARAVRDGYMRTGMRTGSVHRKLNIIRAVWNRGTLELDRLDLGCVFSRLQVPGMGRDATQRLPFTTIELERIASACRDWDDDVRHAVALSINLGTRISEVIGLRRADLFLDHATPHVWFREHVGLGRTLKTANSNRKVPLVGVSLWAAQRTIRLHGRRDGWLFPRYIGADGPLGTHAANTINKWLKALTRTAKTTHSFRHAMRDRLRNIGAPEEIQDVIGGWSSKTVGQRYGEGPGLKLLQGYLNQIAI
jgi:integrase